MERLTKILEVRAPADTVYETWRRFEEFPRFLENISGVQANGSRSTWVAKRIFGKAVRWQAVVTEDVPNTRLRWKSVKGDLRLQGLAEFIPAEGGCVALVVFEYEPPMGLLGRLGALLCDVEGRLEDDLERLKYHIESGHVSATAKRRGILARPAERKEKLVPAAVSN